MADWEGLVNEVSEQAAALKRNAEAFEDNLLARIQAAKQDEILKALTSLDKRLSAIEKKLPDEEVESAPLIDPGRRS